MLAIGLIALMLFLAVVEHYVYEEHSAGQIQVSLSFSPDRGSRGEPTELLVRVEHVGRLPIPWVTIFIHLPPDLVCPAADGVSLMGRMAVPYRGGIVRHYPVTPERRGLYRIERLRVEFSDPLGLVVRRIDVFTQAEFLAHPRPLTLQLHAPTQALMGSIERPALLEDPTATRGVRPYRPDDPLRRVHWPQTARTGDLMAREYATAVDAQIYLVANLATHTPHWSTVDHERLEGVIEAVAGLTIEACRLALPVGLLVNGVAFEATAVTRVRPGASPRHLGRMLDVLARLSSYPSEGPEALLRAAAALPPEASLVFVTGVLPEAWRQGLPLLARRRAVLLMVLSAPGESVAAPRGVRLVEIPFAPATDGEVATS
jgi:uncharacterized protein (DUF58 family)